MASKFYQIAQEVVDAKCSSRFVEEMLITKLCRENGVHGIDSEAQVKIYIGEIKAADEKYPATFGKLSSLILTPSVDTL